MSGDWIERSVSSTGLEYYYPNKEEGRRRLQDIGISAGRERVASDYPYSINRERGQVEQQAAQAYQSWFSRMRQKWVEYIAGLDERFKRGRDRNIKREAEKERNWLNEWDTYYVHEARKLFVSAFVGSYLKEVAEKDEAARPKPQLQPPPQPKPQPIPQPPPQPVAPPPQPSDTAKSEGVTLTIKRIEQLADRVRYFLEINHPGVTDGVETLTIAHPVSATSTSATYGQVASASTYAQAGGDVAMPSTAKKSGFTIEGGGKFNVER
jgi:hypothetical protein